MTKLSREQIAALSREERDRLLVTEMRRVAQERAAAGLCRHCGGAVPCWSSFGDHAPGRHHTKRTLAQRQKELQDRAIELARREAGTP